MSAHEPQARDEQSDKLSSGATEDKGRRLADQNGLIRFIQLAVLWAFCVAQPLFVVTNPELFVGYQSAPIDVVLAAVIITVLPPILLIAVEELAGRKKKDAVEKLHLWFVGGLAAIGGSTLLIGTGNSWLQLFGAGLAGLAVAALYRRFRWVRTTLTVLAPIPLVFLGSYLLISPVSGFALSSQSDVEVDHVKARTPVVMIVLDELPTTSLLDQRGQVDARRYPNFARLARTSTWFKRATTVHWQTHRAVPALLSGHRAKGRDVPSAADYPHNLFTLLGGSYQLHVSEPFTGLCPERLCPKSSKRSLPRRVPTLLGRLARVSGRIWIPNAVYERLRLPQPQELSDVDTKAGVRRFIDDLRPQARPTLDFMHVLLPHVPWEYMPSGKRYEPERGTFIGLKGLERWNGDQWRVTQGQQRHLLQLSYTDSVLGRVLDRLEQQKMLDRSLLVLVADHGVSLLPNEPRREAVEDNLQDILPVPFFVKLPNQRRATVNKRHVETIDVVPTIADALGIRLPFAVDGQSALGRRRPTRPTIYLDSGKTLSLAMPALVDRTQRALDSRISRLGFGPVAPALFDIGPRPELVGRRLSGLSTSEQSGPRVSVTERDDLRDIDLTDELLPTRITGELESPGPKALAIANNGVIVATTHVYDDRRGFSAMIRQSSLRAGQNNVEVLAIPDSGPLQRLPLAD